MQSERWNEASLEQLPVELQVLILEKLTQRDRVTCRRVHSRLRSAFDRCRLLDLVVAPSLPRNACGEPQQCRHCGGGGSERKTGCRLLQCRIADLADTICAAADAAPRWPEEAVPAPAEPEMATPVAAAAAALQGPRHLELRALEALLSRFQGKVQLQLHLASRQWKEGWAQTLLWAVAGRVTEVRFGEEAVGIAQQHSRLDARLLQSLLMRCTKLQRISVGPVEPRLLGSRPTTGAKRALEADVEPGQREGEDVDTETLFMVESWWSNQRGQAGSDAALLDTAAAKTLGWHEMVVGMLPALCRSCRSLQRLAIELKPGARGGVRLPELPGHIDLRLDLGNCHIQGHEEAAAEAPTGALASLTASMNALAGIQQRHLGCLRHLQLHQACWQSGALPSLLHDRLPGTCQCLSSLELSLTTGSHRLYEHLLPRELWQVLPEPRLPVAGEAHVHRWRAGKELSLHRLSALTRLAIHLDPSIDTALHGPPPELEPLLPRPPPPPHPHPHPPAPPAAGVVCISSLPPGLRELSLNGVALTPQLAASLPPVLQRVTLCSWPAAAADDSRAQLCLRIPEEVQELRLSADHASRIDMPPQLRSLSIAPHPASAGNASAWLDVDRLLQAAPTALRHLAIRMPAASAAASQVDLSRFRQLQCLLLDRCASQPDRHAAPDAAPPDDAAAAPASCPLPAVAAPSYDSPRPSPEVLLPRGGLQQLVVVGDLHLAFADPPASCWPPPASAPPLRSPPLPDAAAGAGAQRCALGSVVEIQTLTICNAERPLCAAQRLPPLLYRLGMERWRQQGVRVAELQVFVQAGSASAAPLLPQWAAAVVRRLQLLPVPYPAPGAARAELPDVACKSVNALFT